MIGSTISLSKCSPRGTIGRTPNSTTHRCGLVCSSEYVLFSSYPGFYRHGTPAGRRPLSSTQPLFPTDYATGKATKWMRTGGQLTKYVHDPRRKPLSHRVQRDGRAIHPICPADGSGLQQGPIIPATREDIDTAVSKAAAAQESWANTTFTERRRILNTLLYHILSHQDDIVKACCLDSGKTKIDACFGEILVTAEKLQWTVKHGEKALAPSSRPTNLLMSYKSNKVYYEPLGVVAACVSWNYPFVSSA